MNRVLQNLFDELEIELLDTSVFSAEEATSVRAVSSFEPSNL